MSGDLRREQAFPPVVLRGLPGTGGGFRRLPPGCMRDECVRAVDASGPRTGGPLAWRSEAAVRIGGGKLAAKGASHRSDDHAHVLCGLPRLVAHHVPTASVDEA